MQQNIYYYSWETDQEKVNNFDEVISKKMQIVYLV